MPYRIFFKKRYAISLKSKKVLIQAGFLRTNFFWDFRYALAKMRGFFVKRLKITNPTPFRLSILWSNYVHELDMSILWSFCGPPPLCQKTGRFETDFLSKFHNKTTSYRKNVPYFEKKVVRPRKVVHRDICVDFSGISCYQQKVPQNVYHFLKKKTVQTF